MADTRQQPPRFTQDEAAEIVREATSRMFDRRQEHPSTGSRQLTREDLLALARELGVSEDAVEQVLADRAKRRKRQSRRRGALIGLAAHGMSYGIVMSGLAIVDAMSGPGWWFQWPAVAWGMGLAFHVMGLVLGALKRAGTE
ncbi:2TM domain-containing protein [Cystobacter ferrugineus]|uniref:2TM domain-containing protein n=1 Tax=Cystobacter ferrugineus TaxID=83449 RepID=A0A1L9B1B2_9BACT|nr:2TM domain-containing protein [Cystobacter ferrugineus]OJH36052.1 hypothetical protein BON30_36285 [Cystobacter ferrugineus]